MQEISGKAQDPTRLQNKCLLIYFSAACILFFPFLDDLFAMDTLCSTFINWMNGYSQWVFSLDLGKWIEKRKSQIRVALWSITAGPRLGLIVPTRAQTRASHKAARCRFAFPQLTVHVRCLSYVLTTQLSHSPPLKRAFQTKFPEAWRSNLPFLYLFLLVKVQVCTTLTPQYLKQKYYSKNLDSSEEFTLISSNSQSSRKKISKARELLIAAVKSKTPGKIHSNIGSLMREAEKRFWNQFATCLQQQLQVFSHI